ncbi:MAG: DUF3482 domain-containing protein, partial [Betaproteobacteria bacterium]
RVDLLSLSLLAIVLWNLAIYLVLLLGVFRRRVGGKDSRASAARRLLARFEQWRRRPRHAGVEAVTRFFADWQAATARVTGQRIRCVLHLSAAGWGAGIALSLLMRGLVVEYRTGWESTFLSAEQVHGILSILFMPVLALFSLAPFTLPEIAGMRFDVGSTDAVDSGRRWVYLYAGLLVLVVVLPRLLLAAVAGWRAHALSAKVSIDLDQPYFQQLIDRLSPAQVQLWVGARDEDRADLARVLVQNTGRGVGERLIDTATGDVLRLAEVPRESPVAPVAEAGLWRWLSRIRPKRDSVGVAPDRRDGDVVLQVVQNAGDLESAMPLLHRLGKPVLVLVNSPVAGDQPGLLEHCRLHKKHHAFIAAVLPFDAFSRCWVQERVLLDAIAQCVPGSKAQGFARLAVAWDERNVLRFKRSLTVLSGGLMQAAGEREEVRSAALSLKDIVSKAHRNAREIATTAAMAALVERLRQADAENLRVLLDLHGIDRLAESRLEQGLEVKFDVKASVNTPQAGMAGAASGAAMGASVDVVTGGLTLGVAALLGALVGGSAAFLGAAWKNRSTPSGAATVQLSDEMLQALAEASLLRYLAVIHFGRASGTDDIHQSGPSWNSEVVATVEARRSRLLPLWTAARDGANAAPMTNRLADEMDVMATQVLRNLYPEARISGG